MSGSTPSGTVLRSTVEVRRDDILARLTEHGRVEVGALAGSLGVTEETIRRDLRVLELDGLLQRAHGGAVRAGTGVTDGADTAAALAARAAVLVQDDSTVFLGNGSACEALGALLAVVPGVVLVTASVRVALAAALADEAAVVHLVGGEVDPHGRLTGAWARSQLAGLRVDVAVIEAQGIGVGGRLLHATPEEAAVVDAATSVAATTILLGDAPTFEHGGLAASVPASSLGAAVLAIGVPARIVESLSAAGVRIEAVGADRTGVEA
ncbi:MAG TPA: DeoR/GlpR family DNA-binding transcription regulator [Plantibacter sp.]|uniref:DeoR/GlpR family DNA-binding transcription regulator n=1 Tax=unclassified Plantibacter TaxID=2624265 RepID=UPI002BFF2D03|nr:DeoR/GlpR family DNA-binding transcription regulator [Plantibacter sp.]